MRIAWHLHTLTQGQRNILVCLRCIYGLLNPILFDYNLFTSSLALLLTCQPVNLISCQLFGREFNIMSALFVHQSLSLPQKIDSLEGLY